MDALTQALVQEVREAAEGMSDDLTALRRRLHEHPELGLILPETTRILEEALAAAGVHPERGAAVSSLTLVIEGAAPGPTVVLRADMDALPIQESSARSPRSRIDGRMHACGHDLHSTMLVGAARLLHQMRDRLLGQVVCIWQPGEEGHEGMQAMLAEGLLEKIGAGDSASFALHVLSDTVPNGMFAGRAGVSHATSGTFEITIIGVGGHAAFPHAAKDPVPAAAAVVSALQVAVTRSVNVADPVVITVGSIHAGEAPNVIPASVKVAGTVRAFSSGAAAGLPGLISQVAQGCASTYGVSAEVQYTPGYPVVENDDEEVAEFRRAVTELFGAERFTELAAPIPAGDDMGRLMQRVPGAFFLLGAALPDGEGRVHANHSAEADFDEAVMADGVAAMVWLALRRTGSSGKER